MILSTFLPGNSRGMRATMNSYMPRRLKKALASPRATGRPYVAHGEHRAERGRTKNYRSMRDRRFFKRMGEIKRTEFVNRKVREQLLNKTFKVMSDGSYVLGAAYATIVSDFQWEKSSPRALRVRAGRNHSAVTERTTSSQAVEICRVTTFGRVAVHAQPG